MDMKAMFETSPLRGPTLDFGHPVPFLVHPVLLTQTTHVSRAMDGPGWDGSGHNQVSGRRGQGGSEPCAGSPKVAFRTFRQLLTRTAEGVAAHAEQDCAGAGSVKFIGECQHCAWLQRVRGGLRAAQRSDRFGEERRGSSSCRIDECDEVCTTYLFSVPGLEVKRGLDRDARDVERSQPVGKTRSKTVVLSFGIAPAEHEHSLVGFVPDRFLDGFACHALLRPPASTPLRSSQFSACDVDEADGIGPVLPADLAGRRRPARSAGFYCNRLATVRSSERGGFRPEVVSSRCSSPEVPVRATG